MVTQERLFTDEWFDDPYGPYRRLREQTPVARIGSSSSWLLTGFDAVYGALRDHDTFSSAGGYQRRSLQSEERDGSGLRLVLISDDPPRHTRFRGIVNRAFTPRAVDVMGPAIQQLVDGLLDDVDRRARAGESVDMVEALTVPLPVSVIATMLGIPPSERERFKRWSNALVGGVSGVPGGANDDLREMFGFFKDVMAEKRNQPMGDLITAVAQAEFEGERLEDWEVLGFCVLLLVAGNETTTNLIGNLLNVLVDRPDLWERLRADRALVDPVVEETLRFDSPVQMLFRRTTREVDLAGTRLPADADILVSFAAANRDPAEFEEPDEFRLDRELSKHVAFGAGIHYCLGSPLARAEARAALNGLLDRYPAIERGDQPAERLRMTQMLRGFRALPLSLRM